MKGGKPGFYRALWETGFPLASAEQMRGFDKKAIEECGIPGIVLMERAGGCAAELAVRILGEVKGKPVSVLAGKGNNGGDGFVVARLLWELGCEVSVFLAASMDSEEGEAAQELDILKRTTGIDATEWEAEKAAMVARPELIVDALLGTGITGPARGRISHMIEWINGQGLPVLSLDLPSGAHSDSGEITGPVVRANYTITFGMGKRCFVLEPCADRCGEVWVGDIGLPKRALQGELQGLPQMMTPSTLRSWLPNRPPRGHKGTMGRVLVLGGSRGMSGASVLTGEAALRSGAGMAMIGGPEGVVAQAVSRIPELMWNPLPESSEGSIGINALDEIRKQLQWADVAVVGPGASRCEETAQLLRLLVAEGEKPFVVDADALSAWEGYTELLPQHKGSIVLTPHPGELARIMGMELKSVQMNRIEVAKKAASDWHCTLVLKGANTLIVDPKGRSLVSPFVNAVLATAGSGDVLAGIIGGVAARQTHAGTGSLFEAASLAVWVHGMCGTLLRGKQGSCGACAGDLLDYCGQAMDDLLRKNELGANAIALRRLRRLTDAGEWIPAYE